MPSWKKVITSGSSAHLSHVTASASISGSSTSTGSFGALRIGSDTSYVMAHRAIIGFGDTNDGITIQSGPTHQGNIAFNHSNGTTAHGRISYQHNTNYMSFFTNNSERLRITEGGIDVTGNVTASKIHIDTTANAITGNSVDVSNLQFKILNPANDTGEAVGLGFALSTNSENIGAAIIHDRDGAESEGNLHFATKAAGEAGAADIPINMTLDSSGNLGIGTTSPTHTLHALSTDNKAFLLDRNTGNNADSLNEFSAYYALSIKNRNAGSYLNFGGDANGSEIQATDGAGTATAKTISFNPFGGNVGIGTSSPSATLDVVGNVEVSSHITASGNIKATKFIGDGSELTGVSAVGGIFVATGSAFNTTNNLQITGSVVATANITASKFKGDGSSLTSVDAATLDGSNKAFYRNLNNMDAGTLSVGRGGTGANSFTSNALLTGNGTNAIQAESNLTFNGTTLTVPGAIASSGDITLDSGGDIILDADDTDIILKDGGTAFGSFKRVSSDFVIKAEAQDKDIVFKGNDGGVNTTLMTIDVSERRLGFGTTAPNSKVDVRRSSDGIALELHSTVGDADEFVDFKMISGNATAGTLGTIFRHQRQGTGGGDMIIFTNPSLTGTPAETIRFTSDQKVGIGTSAPDEKLSIENGDIQLENGKELTWADIGDGTTGRVRIYGSEDSDYIRMNVDNNNNKSFALTGTGVGIGTLSPVTNLDVRGEISGSTLEIAGASEIKGNLSVTKSFPDIFTKSGNEGRIGFMDAGGAIESGMKNNSGDLILIADGNTERARVNSDGLKVSGNITASSLEVAGNITAQQYIVSASTTYMTTSFSDGNTKFGDSSGDVHQFTGSFKVQGSILTNDSVTIGSEALESNFSSSIAGRVNTLDAASSGITISNNANNRILTGDGSNANAESNLTFDGAVLGVTSSANSPSPTMQMVNTNTSQLSGSRIEFYRNKTHNSGDEIGALDFFHKNTNTEKIRYASLNASQYATVNGNEGAFFSIRAKTISVANDTIGLMQFTGSGYGTLRLGDHRTLITGSSNSTASFGKIVGDTFHGDGSDLTNITATTATTATNITATANNSNNELNYITFIDGASGTQGIETDTGLRYNPSNNSLTASKFSGTAATATNAVNVGVTNSGNNETVYLAFVDTTTGNRPIEVDTNLNYNPSTNTLTAANITGTVSTATNAVNVAVANSGNNETVYLTFADNTTGNRPLEVDANLNYNPSTNVLTAGTFSGTATTATNAVNVGVANSSNNENVYLTFVDNTTGNRPLEVDSNLSYNPSTNTLTATNITGTVSTATNAVNVGVANSSNNENVYLTFVDNTTGNRPLEVDSNLSYNPSTNVLTGGTFSGNATTATAASNVTVANSSNNENVYLTFVDQSSGNRPLEVDTNLSYNPSTNVLTGGTFSGTFSGTATSATTATNVTLTSNNSTNESVYLTFADGVSGTQGLETDSALSYNPNTNILTAGTFSGNATTATTATNVTATANNSENNALYLTFVDGASGAQGIETDSALRYNPSTDTITAGTLSGTATTATNVTATANNSTDEQAYIAFVDGASGGQGIETDTGLRFNPSNNALTASLFKATDDVVVDDDLYVGGGLIDLKNTGAVSQIRLYCESANAHWVGLQAPAHSDFSGNVQVTLPATATTLIGRNTTDTLTNKTIGQNLLPDGDNTRDLGSGLARWRNLYTGDLHLSNEGSKGNDVDKTTGDWTIQEGQDDLYLFNNKTGKKYKFKLEEL